MFKNLHFLKQQIGVFGRRTVLLVTCVSLWDCDKNVNHNPVLTRDWITPEHQSINIILYVSPLNNWDISSSDIFVISHHRDEHTIV